LNDIKINTTEQYMFCSYGNKELEDYNYKIPSIHDGGSSSFKRYEWVKYSMYDLF